MKRKFRGNFHVLLVFLSLQLLVQPFLRPDLPGRIILNLLTAAFMLAAVLIFIQKRRVMVVALVLMVATFGVGVLTLITSRVDVAIAHQALLAAFGLFMAGVLLKAVLEKGQVSAEKLSGAVCVYLLIGFLWASLFGVLELSSPGSLRFPDVDQQAVHEALQVGMTRGTLIYFSFVTLTTLGYGDIVPVSQVARTLVWAEALIGQLYLTILLARLVGMHISYSGMSRD